MGDNETSALRQKNAKRPKESCSNEDVLENASRNIAKSLTGVIMLATDKLKSATTKLFFCATFPLSPR